MDSMTLKLGQVQLMVGRDKAENLRRACALIRRAAEQGAQLVMLPEMFCCPYENEMFRPNSEEQGGPAQQALSALSRELGIWIVGGTIPEREGEEVAVTELELSRIDAIRRQLPILSARRPDLYEVQ